MAAGSITVTGEAMRAAWHEAAHVVAFAACGFAPASATFDPNAVPAGNAQHRPLTDEEQHAYGEADPELLTRLVVMAMAGEVGEELYYEHNGLGGTAPVGGRDDRERAQRLLECMGLSQVSSALDVARTVLSKRRRLVEILGTYLAVHGNLPDGLLALLSGGGALLTQQELSLVKALVAPVERSG